MQLSDIVTLIAVVVGGGGLFAGIVALIKLRPEAGQITVTTAQGVLIMQTQVIDDLRKTNARLQDRVDALEAENSTLMRRLGQLERRFGVVEALEKRLTMSETRADVSETRADKAQADREGLHEHADDHGDARPEEHE